MRYIFLSLLFVCAFAPAGLTLDFYVDAVNGSPSGSGTYWGSALDTIGAAVDLAGTGDTIHVAEGTYAEAVVLKDGVTLLGGYPGGGGTRDWTVYHSVIDGEDTMRCVTAANGAVLDGFEITRGWSDAGSGVVHSYATMTVRNCRIHHCSSWGGNPQGGGAMYFVNSDSRIENCVFEANWVNVDPDSDGQSIHGGAVHMWTSAPTFISCGFYDNYLVDGTNMRVRLGGAGWAIMSRPEFRGCVFEGNSAMYGGALGWWHESIPVIDSCTFRNNAAVESGGAICSMFHYTPYDDLEPFRIKDCIIQNNTAYYGAGVASLRFNLLTLENCLITGNTAQQAGGGIMVFDDSFLTLRSCTVSDNVLTHIIDTHGSAIYANHTCSLAVYDSIITNNINAPEGIYIAEAGPDRLTVSHSNVYGHTPYNYSRSLIDRTGIAGNISEDPLFVPEMNYELSEPATGDPVQTGLGRSPCIDTGSGPAANHRTGERTTRSDSQLDTGVLDMGFHTSGAEPHFMAVQPQRFEASVPVDAPIIAQARSASSAIVSAQMFLDGVAVAAVSSTDYLGVELEYSPPSELAACTEYTVRLVAEDSDGLTSQTEYTFLTDGCGATPTPTPTSLPDLREMEVQFLSGDAVFSPSEYLFIDCEMYNPNFITQYGDLYVALEVYGDYFFFPYWTGSPGAMLQILAPGAVLTAPVFHVQLPDTLPNFGPIHLYGLLTGAGTLDPASNIALFSFRFTDSPEE